MLRTQAQHSWLFLAALLLFPAFMANADQRSDESQLWLQRSGLAIRTLQSSYNQRTGLYDTTGWWNSANALTTLADYSRVSGSKEYLGVFSNTLSAAPKTHADFLNNFYDDEGWWALAWIDVYDLTHESRYLVTAQSIFADMAGGWDESCGGGIWWSKDRKYKNAIANELFLSVAAHLALRSVKQANKREYLSWAKREWKWFAQSTMIDRDNLINDGLDATCKNNGKTKWSYNQGVVLGGLAALSQATHDEKLLDVAEGIARATMTYPSLLVGHQILHDPCEPDCGEDGTQFKGIFVRNLRELNDQRPSPAAQAFLLANAESIWSHGDQHSYKFSVDWLHGAGPSNASTQSSALDALIAASQR